MQAQTKLEAFKNEMREAALEYVRRGWSIVPISLTSKVPLIKWERFQNQAAALDVVEGWFANGVETESGVRHEGFGIGIITGAVSGLIVVDCDNVEAIEAAESLGYTSEFAVRTRKGMHYYFKHPGGEARFANRASSMGAAGLDLRGDGGLVVAPPTTIFDSQTGMHKHTYEWIDEDHLDWSQLPVWRGAPTVQSVSSETFCFDRMSLADVDHKKSNTVTGEIIEQMLSLGRKLQDGDGRNNWLTRYAGERCKTLEGEALVADCMKFMSDFFESPLPIHEFQTTLASVVKRDMRNHPERYDSHGKLRQGHQIDSGSDEADPVIPELPQDQESAQRAFKPIFCEDLEEIQLKAGSREYWLEPIIEPNSITQVVGFNGSGKTWLLMNALWSAACGKRFGALASERKPRVLYFDWELSLGIMADRMKEMREMFGSPGESFMIWSQASGHDPINLTSKDGMSMMLAWVKANKPDIVVMDTVRSAFRGMNENSVEEWSRVNAFMKAIRNMGIAVVFVHHRNKPGMNGMGREAGSTAQLTDVDTQIVITKVSMSKAEAEAQAAKFDRDTKVYDLNGKKWTAFEYLSLKTPGDFTLKYVAELSYGKVRQPTELHMNHYFGLAVNLTTGAKRVVSTLSPKQQAKVLNDGTRTTQEIANKLDIPLPLVEQWLG